MSLPSPIKFCSICSAEIVGRRDKIFCSQKCKSFYHRHRKKQHQSITNPVDKMLHRNWVILQEYYERINKRKFFIPKAELVKEGFKLDYHTTSQKNKKGKTYYYIYNFGWMDFSDKDLMVIHLAKSK